MLLTRGYRVKNFMEIGSRDGDDANAFARAAGISEVHIIEPAPLSAEAIRHRYPHFRTYQLAMSNEGGRMRFHNVVDPDPVRRGMSSLMGRGIYDTLPTEVVDVEVMRGDDFLRTHGIDEVSACKIDVEGHAVEVLEGFGELLTRIQAIHLECEMVPVWEGQRLYGDARRILESKGFTQISFFEYNQPTTQSDSIWIRTPPPLRPVRWWRRVAWRWRRALQRLSPS